MYFSMSKWTLSGLSAMLIFTEQHGISVAEVLSQECGPSSYIVSVSPQQGRPSKSCTESGHAVILHKERKLRDSIAKMQSALVPRVCQQGLVRGSTILSAGSSVMETSRKALSRKGTRGSRPKAKGALLARMTSYWCNRLIRRTVSLQA